MVKTALICGISGQDGAYLAAFLLRKGYRVVGTSRDALVGSFHNLEILGIEGRVELISMTVSDFRSVLNVLSRTRPDELYNLSGQTSVRLSFEQPVEAVESIAIATLNLLEAIRFLDKGIRFFSAGSSECYGDTSNTPANEFTAFQPPSPYAVAKATAFWEVANYREAYGLFACTGTLFNHESPLRPEHFVTQKVVRAACDIAAGSIERLRMGNLSIYRDWGWAPEYVEAMWMMLQAETPVDYVIATGETSSLEEFVQRAFHRVGLNWNDHVEIDTALLRPNDLQVSRADPRRISETLGWQAKSRLPAIVNAMIDSRLARRGLAPRVTAPAGKGGKINPAQSNLGKTKDGR